MHDLAPGPSVIKALIMAGIDPETGDLHSTSFAAWEELNPRHYKGVGESVEPFSAIPVIN